MSSGIGSVNTVPPASVSVQVIDVTACKNIRIIVKSVYSSLCPSTECYLIEKAMILNGN